jgi:hypothetical protein
MEMVLKVALMALPYLIGFVAGYATRAAISLGAIKKHGPRPRDETATVQATHRAGNTRPGSDTGLDSDKFRPRIRIFFQIPYLSKHEQSVRLLHSHAGDEGSPQPGLAKLNMTVIGFGSSRTVIVSGCHPKRP